MLIINITIKTRFNPCSVDSRVYQTSIVYLGYFLFATPNSSTKKKTNQIFNIIFIKKTTSLIGR